MSKARLLYFGPSYRAVRLVAMCASRMRDLRWNALNHHTQPYGFFLPFAQSGPYTPQHMPFLSRPNGVYMHVDLFWWKRTDKTVSFSHHLQNVFYHIHFFPLYPILAVHSGGYSKMQRLRAVLFFGCISSFVSSGSAARPGLSYGGRYDPPALPECGGKWFYLLFEGKYTYTRLAGAPPGQEICPLGLCCSKDGLVQISFLVVRRRLLY